jgi:hypothetical protein
LIGLSNAKRRLSLFEACGNESFLLLLEFHSSYGSS